MNIFKEILKFNFFEILFLTIFYFVLWILDYNYFVFYIVIDFCILLQFIVHCIIKLFNKLIFKTSKNRIFLVTFEIFFNIIMGYIAANIGSSHKELSIEWIFHSLRYPMFIFYIACILYRVVFYLKKSKS